MAKGWSFGGLVAALRDAAFKSTGTTAGTVAAGDDTRIVRAVQRTGDTMTGELKIARTSNSNSFRIFDTAYGAIFRRSENALHIIPTAQGQGESGDIGSLRPFTLGLDTGILSNAHGIDMTHAYSSIKANNFTNSVQYNDSVPPQGAGGFANQHAVSAPFNQDNAPLTIGSSGVYVPLIKQKTTRAGRGWTTTMSLGTLMPGGADQFGTACIHMQGDSNVTSMLWQFALQNGTFTSPGSVRAGTASLNVDGNIAGDVWGGDLRSWLVGNLIGQDFCSVAGFSSGNTQYPYMRQRNTNEVVYLARQDWVNQYFLTGIRYSGSGTADNGNNDNNFAEAPSPSTVYGVLQKENYTAVHYTYLQMNRNGTWITVGRI